MNEHPIIFSCDEVNAILEGRKTQARRVIKPQPVCDLVVQHGDQWLMSYDGCCAEDIDKRIKCPYGTCGDRLWVKEPFSKCGCRACKAAWPNKTKHNVIYKVSNQMADINFCSPIFMPRWASRITLEITDIKVERVQDITEEDARAEGVNDGGCLNCGNKEPCGCTSPNPNARDSFIFLWDSTNAKRGYGWLSNPWVWKIEFRLV